MHQLKGFSLVILLAALWGCGGGGGSSGSDGRDSGSSTDAPTKLESVYSKISDPVLRACVETQAADNQWQHVSEFSSLYCKEQLSTLKGLDSLTYLRKLDIVIPYFNDTDIDVIASLPLDVYQTPPRYLFNSGEASDSIPFTIAVMGDRSPVVEYGDKITKLRVLIDHDSDASVLDPERFWTYVRPGVLGAKARKVNRNASLHWLNARPLLDDPHIAYFEPEKRIRDSFVVMSNAESGEDVFVRSPEIEIVELNLHSNSELEECIKQQAVENSWRFSSEVEELDCSGRGITYLSGIEKLRNLKRVNLANNNIKYVFDEFKYLENLEWLDISNNKLVSAIEHDRAEVLQTGQAVVIPTQNTWGIYQDQGAWKLSLPHIDGNGPYQIEAYSWPGKEEPIVLASDVSDGMVLDSKWFNERFPVLGLKGSLDAFGDGLRRYVTQAGTGIIAPDEINVMPLSGGRLLVQRFLGFNRSSYVLLGSKVRDEVVFSHDLSESIGFVAAYDDYVYFLKEFNSLYRLDLNTKAFEFISDLPSPLVHYQQVLVGSDYLWLLGAEEQLTLTSKAAYRLNLKERTWEKMPDTNLISRWAGYRLLDSSGASIGGAQFAEDLAYWEAWNDQDAKWVVQQVSDMQAEMYPSFVMSDGYRYRFNLSTRRLLGTDDWPVNLVPLEVYSEEIQSWIPIEFGLIARHGVEFPEVDVIEDSIQISTFNSVQVYTPSLDSLHPFRKKLDLNWFDDGGVRQCLMDYYGADPDVYVLDIKDLSCSNYEIQSVSGIEKLDFLVSLDLSNNRIVHYFGQESLGSELIDRKRRQLYLQGLERLDLSGNQISSFPNASNMRLLKRLDLSGNHLQGVSGLDHVPEVILDGNPIKLAVAHFRILNTDGQWVLDISDYDASKRYDVFIESSSIRKDGDGYVDDNYTSVSPKLTSVGENVDISTYLSPGVNWIYVLASLGGRVSEIQELGRIVDTRGRWEQLVDVRLDSGLEDLTVSPDGWLITDYQSWMYRPGSDVEFVMLTPPFDAYQPFRNVNIIVTANGFYARSDHGFTTAWYKPESNTLDFLPFFGPPSDGGSFLVGANGPVYIENEGEGAQFGYFYNSHLANWDELFIANRTESSRYIYGNDAESVFSFEITAEDVLKLRSCEIEDCVMIDILNIEFTDLYKSSYEDVVVTDSAFYLIGGKISRLDRDTWELSQAETIDDRHMNSLDYVGYDNDGLIFESGWYYGDKSDRRYQFIRYNFE